MRNLNITAILIVLSFFFTKCNNDKSDSQVASTNNQQEKAKNLEGTAEFRFEETTKDLGKIQKGQKVVKGFIFKNTGDEPLVISDASASCGCTVPEYSDDPVPPGETGYVDVEYDSKGKSPKTFEQSVTLVANTQNSPHKVTITGEVIDENQGQTAQPGNKKQIDLNRKQKSQESSPVSSGSSGKDKFGRGPDHPHYQHDHPPKNQQEQGQKKKGDIQLKQQNVEKGEKDKHGRGPDHEHYRHNHPPKDE